MMGSDCWVIRAVACVSSLLIGFDDLGRGEAKYSSISTSFDDTVSFFSKEMVRISYYMMSACMIADNVA